MKKEFLIDRQGKTFALYAGLLDEAHTIGIESILTNLIQIPDESNGNVAICSATVSMVGGKQFSGIGDAAPNNVTKLMATCLIRMAETRAKARALRDAINVGVAALEELAEDEGQAQAPKAPNGSASAPKPANGTNGANPTPIDPRAKWESLWKEATEVWKIPVEKLPTVPEDAWRLRNNVIREKGNALLAIVQKARAEDAQAVMREMETGRSGNGKAS